MRGYAAHYVVERKVFTGVYGNWLLSTGKRKAEGADEQGEQADRGQTQRRLPPERIKDHAQWSAQRHGAIGADAVEGDDLGGAVVACAGNAPQCRAGRAEALA